jgi:hypothetical protein
VKGFRGGEGRAVAIYSCKGQQVPGKRLYISPQLASQFEKSGRVGLGIFRVDIEPLI